MNTKWSYRWGIILILAGFAIGIPGVYLLIARPYYEAVAEISVTSGNPEVQPGGGALPDSPYFLQTEFEVMRSPLILSNVVTDLRLDAEWGNRYAGGRKLTRDEAMNLLKQTLHLRPVQNTTLVELGVISDAPAEAANIANSIAETYRDFRNEQTPRQFEVKILNLARPPMIPLNSSGRSGQILLGAGVLSILAGVRLWWKAYFAAPTT